MKALLVQCEDRITGRLTAHDRILSFEYEAEWLAWDGAFPLTPGLPLVPGSVAGDKIVSFFANLLPEGPVLDALLKLKRLPKGDIFAQLGAFGEESAGAFSVVPEGRKRPRTPQYMPYSPDEISCDVERMKHNLPLLARHGELRLSLAGAQNKITVKYDGTDFWLPKEGAASTHILKAPLHPGEAFPDSVLNEAFCLGLSEACGLATATAEIVRLPDPMLVVRRHDRVEEGGIIRRLHQLDFCQITGRLPDQKYEADGGPSLSEISQALDDLSTTPGRDRLRLLDWTVFNYLTGNADAHAKNLSMLVRSGGRLELAPFYDLLATAVYQELDDRLALGIGGERRPKWVMERHWRAFADGIGMNPLHIKGRALGLAAKVRGSAPVIATTLGIPPEGRLMKQLLKIMNERARWMEDRMP